MRIIVQTVKRKYRNIYQPVIIDTNCPGGKTHLVTLKESDRNPSNPAAIDKTLRPKEKCRK